MKGIRRLGIFSLYRICLLFLCFSYCNSTFATSEEVERVKFLVIWEDDGGVVSFPLSDSPCITFDVEKAQVNCMAAKKEIRFSMQHVRKYTLESISDPLAGLEDITVCQGDVSLHSHTLYFERFPPQTRIMVHMLDGKLKSSYHVGEDGRLEISTFDWKSGIYLVKTGTITYKFMKK